MEGLFGICGITPLCHFVTSPPQGGRLGARGIPQPISTLEGEMPDRAEGGDAARRDISEWRTL